MALVRTNVSEEHIASKRVTRISKLGTLAVTSNRSMQHEDSMFHFQYKKQQYGRLKTTVHYNFM
jgi:hypothetical protein